MDEPPLTPLHEVLATARLDGASGEALLPDDWTQGRTIYGGLSAAAGLAALRAAAPELPPLRSLLVQFVGPVEPGEVRLERRLLREGASLTQWAVELWQGDTPRVLLTASYGPDRRSRAARAGPLASSSALPDEGRPIRHQPGVTPTFMRHLDYRVTLGEPPLSGATRPRLGGWVRFREPGEVHAEPLVALLADAWPPPALSMLTRPRPASTVSWHLALTPEAAQATPDSWALFDSEAPHAAAGFAPVRAALWDAEGRALALSQQLDAVFG